MSSSSERGYNPSMGNDESLKQDGYSILEKAPAFNVQPQTLSSRKLHPAFDTMRWACAISHVGLISLLALFAFRQPDKDDSSIISFSHPTFNISDDVDADIGQTLQAGVKLGFGWIVTGWTIVLTLTTQKLALRRQLNLTNSLTAKHDANEAWMGLGSSILASLKWRQLGVRESSNSIFLPLLYLAGIASLHSVGVGMFGLVPKSVNKNFLFSSQGIPDFTTTAANALSGSSALLTVLSLNTIDFPGLASGGVGVTYDIPSNVSQFPVDIRQVQVNATHFNVSCGALSGSVQNFENNGPAFFFESGFGVENTFLAGFDTFPNTLSQNGLALRPAPWGPAFSDVQPIEELASWPSSILIFTTVPVVDSSGTTVPQVTVSPPMTYVPQSQTSRSSSTSQLTALACNLTVDALPNNVTIDPVSNALLSPLNQVNKTSAELDSFPTTFRAPIEDVNTPQDALITIWSVLQIASVSPLFDQVSNLCTANNTAEVCGSLYEPEQFVMESLNIFPDLLLPSTSDDSTTIDLTDLENILSRMTAIEFWAEGQGNNLKFTNRISTSEGISVSKTFVTNNNTVEFSEILLVFAINRTQLHGAFAVAIFLFLLAIPSLLDNNSLKIDSIGILQMIWLANDHPELQQSITKLSDPSTDELRKEGMLIKRNFHNHNAEGLPQQPC